MATRSITTSAPAVQCDVCGRNLLRGELPDLFLAGGQRRTVCELCVARATHEGWLREGQASSESDRPPRGRRARTLMGRFRALGEQRPSPASLEDAAGEGSGPASFTPAGPDDEYQAHEPLAPERPARVAPVRAPGARVPRSVHAVPTNAELKVVRAVEVFNAGDPPRRIAGVARSLGAPSVSVRPVSATGTAVAIVISWELCWYRYEVDLADQGCSARVVSQGSELDELEADDRVVNAGADEDGRLHLLVSEVPAP